RIRTEALDYFDAFYSREPVSTSLENALRAHRGDLLAQARRSRDGIATGTHRNKTEAASAREAAGSPLQGALGFSGRPTSISAAAKPSAHHASEERAGSATAAAVVPAAATTGMAHMVSLVVAIVGGRHAGGDDLGHQRLVLQRIEVAGRGIAARG